MEIKNARHLTKDELKEKRAKVAKAMCDYAKSLDQAVDEIETLLNEIKCCQVRLEHGELAQTLHIRKRAQGIIVAAKYLRGAMLDIRKEVSA